MNSTLSFAAGLAAWVIGSCVAVAGPLNPPAGPIVPTAKPLGEVEPRVAINATNTPGDVFSLFRITQSGSYYLTGDLVGVSGRSGIRIDVGAGGVSIDLNGFTVRGVPGATNGIEVVSGPARVVNGIVVDWPANGVQGVSVVDRVIARFNGAAGIAGTNNAQITNCVALNNGGLAGSYGIQTFNGGSVLDCTVSGNGGPTAGGGISVGSGSQVRRCVAISNARNMTGGSGYGITAGFDSVVSECRVNENGSIAPATTGGISANSGTSVFACTLYSNLGEGIRTAGEAIVSGNSVIGTGGSGVGILVSSGAARVEGNHLYSNIVGIRVPSSGSTIFRNSSRSNTTPYDISAGNDVGPIGTAATSTSPWANISN